MVEEIEEVGLSTMMRDVLHAVERQGEKIDALQEDMATMRDEMRPVRTDTSMTRMQLSRMESKLAALNIGVMDLDERVAKLVERS